MSTVIAWLTIRSAVCIGVWSAALAGKRSGVATVAVVGLFASCLFGPWTMFTWILCGLVAGVAVGRKWSYGPSVAAVTIAALAMAGYRGMVWTHDLAELQTLQAKFPVQSLDDRLSRLRPPALSLDAPVTALMPANMSSGFHRSAAPLDDLEFEYDRGQGGYRREAMLRSLADVHGTVERQFHQREGFGVIRSLAMWPRQEVLELPEPEPIPQSPPSSDPGSLPAWTEFPATLPPNSAELHDLHRQGQLSFVDPRSLGFVDVRQAVPMTQAVGFQAHAFRTRPQLPSIGTSRVQWQVTEVELVSLLKETSPAVYQSDHLPNLEHISHNDVPLRPLDAFETSALSRLQHGEDVVIDDHPGEIRVLGSLRAVRQCLDCHSVNRGTLLGAFTYRLQPPTPMQNTALPEL
ncbi:MAG: hypothetical protein SH850_06990 [Planctomycetaceae bacterium]|nr:hypothetical protein [Planctomycetaceae bacterium]